MATTDTVRDEERAARQAHREQQRRQRDRNRDRDKAQQTTLAQVIREELDRPRARNCTCGISTRTTKNELMAMGAGCTAGQYVCPVLDAIRRRISR